MKGALAGALALSVLIVAAGAWLGLSYYLTSTLVVLCALAPFFVDLERRKPEARELVVLATLIALAVIARVAFAPIPHFKPTMAIVMIAGMAFGGRSGFLVGAGAMLVSNLLFGQGPWTPWQMLAFGTGGLAAGVATDALVRRGLVKRGALTWPQRLALAAGGFLLVVCVAGPLLDTCSLFMMITAITPASAAAIYLAGLPVNIIHGAATFLTLLLLANPLLRILNRVRVKYGLLG